MFSKIIIDYYGTPTPLTQMASIGVPEPRMAIIKPYDASQLGAMEKAIRDSDLGVNPNNEGTQLRILLPQMTEERRRDMIKVARHKGEDAKVAIRNVRRKAKEELDRIVKDGEAGEDDGPPRREGARRPDPQVRRRTSTSWSSTRKPSCSRSDVLPRPLRRADASLGRPATARTCRRPYAAGEPGRPARPRGRPATGRPAQPGDATRRTRRGRRVARRAASAAERPA